MAIRILIGEKYNSNIAIIERICKLDQNLNVIASVTKASDLITSAIRLRPHVIIASASLTDLTIEETIVRIMKQAPTAILILHSDRYQFDLSSKILSFGIIDKLQVFIINNKMEIVDTVLTTRIYILSKLKVSKFSGQIKDTLLSFQKYQAKLLRSSRVNPSVISSTSGSNESEEITLTEISDFEKFTEVYVPSGPVKYSGKSRINKIIVIGTSTGGPRLLAELVPQFPVNFPPVLIVQHMPEGFISSFAKRLNRLSEIRVQEAKDNMIIAPGNVYVAPGGFHLKVIQNTIDNRVKLHLSDAAPVNYVKPSVDVTLKSACMVYGSKIISVILTGMGNDGRDGCELVKSKGGKVIALNEADSDIYGMNKSVIEAGYADLVVGRQEMILAIIRAIEGRF